MRVACFAPMVDTTKVRDDQERGVQRRTTVVAWLLSGFTPTPKRTCRDQAWRGTPRSSTLVFIQDLCD
jgi:hypothetical protein